MVRVVVRCGRGYRCCLYDIGRCVVTSLLRKFRRIRLIGPINGAMVAIASSIMHFGGTATRILGFPTRIGVLVGSGAERVTIAPAATGTGGTIGFDGNRNGRAASMDVGGTILIRTVSGCFALIRTPRNRISFTSIGNATCPRSGAIVFSITGTATNAVGHHNHGGTR